MTVSARAAGFDPPPRTGERIRLWDSANRSMPAARPSRAARGPMRTTLLTAADAAAPLGPDNLNPLATAAYLIGEDEASVQLRTRAHAGFLERGDTIRAAASALWLAFVLLDRPSQRTLTAGRLARAQRLLDAADTPCVEQGWLRCAAARQRVAAGEFAAANAAFTEAAGIGARFGDNDLVTLARHRQGRSLLAMNQTNAGLELLDEVMVAIAGGEVGPIVTGAVYCSVISACNDLFDLRRAQEWLMRLRRGRLH